jgi:hypothetical protein
VDLGAFPFYRARLGAHGVPEPWSLEDLEDYARTHDDAFGGRLRPGARPPVVLQIEATSEPPVWSALERDDLDAWAGSLSRIWKRFGVARGEAIAFFEYGSNPCVLLSSSIYVSHLRRGAATRLGTDVICNDGVANMTGRMLVVLETVRPSGLVIRRDLIAPFVDALSTRGLPPRSRLRWAAVTEVEGAPTRTDAERLEAAIGVPVRRLLRADAAFFVAGDCARCGLFHLDRAHQAESLGDGTVAVSARFGGICPAIRYQLGAADLVSAGCGAEPRARRVAWG